MTTAITKDSLAARIADLEYGPRSLKEDYTLAAYKMLLETMEAALDSEPNRNPVLAYADSYRDMAKQGVESVPIWSVITDLERNIAPLYRHAPPAPIVPDDIPYSVYEILCQACGGKAWMYEEALWNACRAAMLNQK